MPHQLTKSDAIPYLLAAAYWVGDNIDLILGRAIAFCTLVFTVLKICQLIRNWNRKDRGEE